jgi:hypothetical protein
MSPRQWRMGEAWACIQAFTGCRSHFSHVSRGFGSMKHSSIGAGDCQLRQLAYLCNERGAVTEAFRCNFRSRAQVGPEVLEPIG